MVEHYHPAVDQVAYLSNPDFSDYESDVTEVIKNGMAQIRWNAMSDDIFYLGTHAENVRRVLEDNNKDALTQFYGLHHDSAEAVLGDLVRPVRKMIDGYDVMESELLDSLWECYGIDSPSSEEWDEVMEADDQVLMWELDQIFPENDRKEDTLYSLIPEDDGRDPEDIIGRVDSVSVEAGTPMEARDTFARSHSDLMKRIG
jgi:5'-deoxynucleotidase YfbR-like HD superfamily hydrolase